MKSSCRSFHDWILALFEGAKVSLHHIIMDHTHRSSILSFKLTALPASSYGLMDKTNGRLPQKAFSHAFFFVFESWEKLILLFA